MRRLRLRSRYKAAGSIFRRPVMRHPCLHRVRPQRLHRMRLQRLHRMHPQRLHRMRRPAVAAGHRTGVAVVAVHRMVVAEAGRRITESLSR